MTVQWSLPVPAGKKLKGRWRLGVPMRANGLPVYGQYPSGLPVKKPKGARGA
jgi:hypothetical protein